MLFATLSGRICEKRVHLPGRCAASWPFLRCTLVRRSCCFGAQPRLVAALFKSRGSKGGR